MFLNPTNLNFRWVIPFKPYLQSNVNELEQWSVNHNMKLNPKKCSVMTVSFMRTTLPVVSIGDQIINQTDCVKLLGVNIQSDLKWSTQINVMMKKANARLHMLRVLTKFRLPLDDLVQVYISYIRPVHPSGTLVHPPPKFHKLSAFRNARVAWLWDLDIQRMRMLSNSVTCLLWVTAWESLSEIHEKPHWCRLEIQTLASPNMWRISL